MKHKKTNSRLAITLIIIFISLCFYIFVSNNFSVKQLNYHSLLSISTIIFFISIIVIISLFSSLVKSKKYNALLLKEAEMSPIATAWSQIIAWELIVDSGEMIFSDSFFLLTGYEKPLFELSLLSLKQRIHPDDIDDFNKFFKKTDNFGIEMDQVRFRIKKHNGEYICVDATARVHYNKNKKLQLAGFFLDVTKIVKDEKKLIHEGKIIDKLMQLASIQAWTWNTQEKQFKFILNTSLENKSIETLEGFLNFILEKDAQKVSVALSDYINQKTSECYVQFRDKTGEKWYEFLAYILSYDSNTQKPFLFVGFQRDITERKRLSELYYESQKVETISRLAGGMAHDFNNILQVIHGFVDLAMIDIEEDSETGLNMLHALQGIEKAEALVEQLLTFSRDDLNRPFPLIVSDALNNFVNLISRKLEEKNILFEFKNNIDNSRVYADPKKLDQILSKLIDNSIAAVSLDHGRIKIETNFLIVDKPETKFGLSIQPGRYIIVSVEDNGCGIDAAVKPLIFEPFFTTKDIGEGRGLGLSTVHNCVRSHEGLINVVSRPEIEGTRFEIYFPEYVLINKKESPTKVTNTLNNNNCPVVLIVDDFQTSINIIKKHLGNKYAILESRSDTEALELFEEMHESIDVVILDCIMHNTNGLKIYKQMLSKKADLPVIFMSGYTKNDVEKQFGEEIKNIFLLKPLQKEVLLTAVNSLIKYDYKE